MATVCNTFEFPDKYMDMIEDEYPPLSVYGNTATSQPIPFGKLKSELAIGQSFRFPVFSVYEPEHPWVNQMRFELRIFPSGQFSRWQSPNVYVVLVECPEYPEPLPEFEVSIAFNEVGQWRQFAATASHTFDWANKASRFVKLDVTELGHHQRHGYLMLVLTAKIKVKSNKRRYKDIFACEPPSQAATVLVAPDASVDRESFVLVKKERLFSTRSSAAVEPINDEPAVDSIETAEEAVVVEQGVAVGDGSVSQSSELAQLLDVPVSVKADYLERFIVGPSRYLLAPTWMRIIEMLAAFAARFKRG